MSKLLAQLTIDDSDVVVLFCNKSNDYRHCHHYSQIPNSNCILR